MFDNEDRVASADAALDTFCKATGSGRQAFSDDEAVSDLLCNLMHYCTANDLNFLNMLNRGASNFQAEVEFEDDETDLDEKDPAASAVNPHHYARLDGPAPSYWEPGELGDTGDGEMERTAKALAEKRAAGEESTR